MASSSGNSSSTCPSPMAATSNGVWQGDHPIHFALPLLIIQTCLVLLLTRSLAFVLKPLRQPRVIAEIIGGILLGPSALGHSTTYMNSIFPKPSITVLDTVAGMGLLFFLFMVGLELDLQAIRRTGRQALAIAAAGISLPFAAGVGVSLVLHNTVASGAKFTPFLVFMGVAMSITAFPVLARILAERKLLTTDVGQMAMSAAAVNDVAAWILLALAVALSGADKSPKIAAWVLMCGFAFVLVMFYAVKPIMTWIARQTVENEPLNELHVCITFAGVLAAGFATDAIGIHSIFGAFVFGLIIPKEGPFAGMIIEKIEDLVTVLMLPLYFASSGLKTDVGTMRGARAGGLLVLVITTACVGKILGTFLVARAYKMNFRKSLTLGFLMNTKGLVELIVLNIGRERKVLNDETFAIMVLMALFTTFITTPVVMALYKPARDTVPYTQRKLDHGSPIDDEFRILACVHGITNVPAIINLVETSRGTRKHPLRLYILHLVEFSERSSSIMIVQRARKDGRPYWSGKSQRDNIGVAFEAYGQLSKVTVRPMKAVSGFADMHDDICTTAADKRAAIIILPYHKHPGHADGAFDIRSSGFRTVNQQVLLHAPCSVGILIDRGVGGMSLSSSNCEQQVAAFFFGGPDDREALVFGYRMAEHPGVTLTVFRFVSDPSSENNIVISMPQQSQDQSEINEADANGGHLDKAKKLDGECFPSSGFSMTRETYHLIAGGRDLDKEKQLDDECLAMARIGEVDNGAANPSSQSIFYHEQAINNPVDAAVQIGKRGSFNLLLVGRARRPSPSIHAHFAGGPAESAELGPIGDALVSHGPEIRASILVIQQYDSALPKESPST